MYPEVELKKRFIGEKLVQHFHLTTGVALVSQISIISLPFFVSMVDDVLPFHMSLPSIDRRSPLSNHLVLFFEMILYPVMHQFSRVFGNVNICMIVKLLSMMMIVVFVRCFLSYEQRVESNHREMNESI